MRIVIDNKGFSFGGSRFIYDLYYVEGEAYDASTLGGVFKNLLVRWAKALEDISEETGPMYLPFAPDDEWIECFMATPQTDVLIFNVVRLAENGWSIDFDNLESFIRSPHAVLDSYERFGEFPKNEVILALLDAEVIDV